MTDLKRQLKEDRAIRGAARSILAAQVAQVRQGLSGQRIGEQLADRIGDPALKKLESVGTPIKAIAGAVAGAAAVFAVVLAWKPFAAKFAAKNDDEVLETDDDA